MRPRQDDFKRKIAILVIVVALLMGGLMALSLKTLPPPPTAPTPTYPKSIDLPDNRPVPRR